MTGLRSAKAKPLRGPFSGRYCATGATTPRSIATLGAVVLGAVRVVGPLLAASLLMGASGAVGSAEDPPSSEPCSGVKSSESEAALEAARCGRAVEIASARTPWNTLHAQADGTMRLDVSATAVRTDVTGAWAPIDTAVVEGENGFVVASPVTVMEFSNGQMGAPLVRMSRAGHDLTFDVPFDLPAPTVSAESQLTYREVLPGVDLIVTVNDDATGFIEVLEVKSAAAAANPVLDSLTFPVTTSDGLDLVADRGGFAALDAHGVAAFASPSPQMWDSRPAGSAQGARMAALSAGGPTVPDVPIASASVDRTSQPSGGEAIAAMPVSVGDAAVTIVPDDGLLSSLSTVWPVYIDPQVNSSLTDWSAVRDVYAQSYRFSPDQGVGICNKADPYGSSCSTTFRSRLLWRFGGLQGIGSLTSADIISATFSAVGTSSYNCTPREVSLYRINNWTSSTPWPGSPGWTFQSTVSVAHKSSCATQPVRWIGWDATESARAVADANTTDLSLGLAANESSMAWWHRYRNDATFSVVYNRLPDVPSNPKFTVPEATCVMGSGRPVFNTPTPTFGATHTDRDGDVLQANMDVYRAGTNTMVSHTRPAAQASGIFQAYAIPRVDDGTYRVQMNSVEVVNGAARGGGAVACEFTVDTVRPVNPSMTVAAGYAATYPYSVASGGIGLTGGFTIGDGGSADVARYLYSFGSTAFDKTATPASPTITFTPTSTSPVTLYVKSVDAAGNVSEITSWVIKVAASEPHVWKFDAGTGTTATGTYGAGAAPTLTLTSGTVWVTGPLVDSGTPGDHAVLFDSATDAASSAVPVVATAEDYWVSAIVRADAASGTATAVSQSGTVVSGFQLGYRPCADGVGVCWAFSVPTSDSATASTSVAVATGKVTPGDWVQVTGARVGTTLQLSTCNLGEAPTVAASAPLTGSWTASGVLEVGRAKGAANPWPGAVSDLRVGAGQVAPADLDRWCNGGL